jgi:hypothetical protein
VLRRSLFLGLTILLGAVLVWLVVNSRKEEARIASVPGEIVRTAKSSPTRALLPKDLDPSGSRADLRAREKAGRGNKSRIAHLDLVVRNLGSSPYSDPAVRLEWINSRGAPVGAETKVLPGVVRPGQAISVSGVVVEAVPEQAVRCNISILHADVVPAAAK